MHPLLLFVLLLAWTTTPVNAQLPDAGSAIVDRPSAEPLPVPGFAPPTEPDSGLEKPKIREEPPSFAPRGGPAITVRKFRFEGNTVVTEEELQAIAQPFVGVPIGAADLEELRFRLTKLYVDNGYVNSGAILPDQPFIDGILTYRLIEGELDEIRIDGNGRLRPGYIRNRLRLGLGKPLNINNLQESFQMLLLDPMIDRLNGNLVPGPEPGKSELDLQVTRSKSFELSIIGDNHRPPSTGAEEARAEGVIRNLTGFGDILSFSLRRSDGATDITTGFSIPVTTRDTRLLLQYRTSDSTVVEEPLEDADIDSDFYSFDVGVEHPVWRTLNRNLTLGARFAVRRNKNQLLSRPFSFSPGEENGRSKVSVLRLSQEFVDRRPKQVFAARSTLSFGLDVFGATHHGGDLPDGQFFAWLGQAQYVRRVLDNGAEIVLRSDLQLADDKLLPLEKIALGGANTVRGYRENELVRDQGVIASIEFRYPLFSSPTYGTLQIAPFVDIGFGWDKDKDFPTDNRELQSVGVGLRYSLPPRLTAELYWGHDLKSAPSREDHNLQDDGIHFRLALTMF